SPSWTEGQQTEDACVIAVDCLGRSLDCLERRAMPIYTVHGPAIGESAVPDWGDYSDILISGLVEQRPDGMLAVSRTGPYVPPVVVTDDGRWATDRLVVTDRFKAPLELSGLSGLVFYPAIKHHIVPLDWETWDWSADEPEQYPESGEPEDYVLAMPHSEQAAAEMEDLWEVRPAESTRLKPSTATADWNGPDLFKVHGSPYIFVSARAKSWLERAVGDWVSFRPVPLTAMGTQAPAIEED
ncbi:MAG TPA: hypothetical protein VM536_21965, partial [Chloroflexia bacterium]|nr:hypothetical protein [Chloroflexia bacterium]